MRYVILTVKNYICCTRSMINKNTYMKIMRHTKQNNIITIADCVRSFEYIIASWNFFDLICFSKR